MKEFREIIQKEKGDEILDKSNKVHENNLIKDKSQSENRSEILDKGSNGKRNKSSRLL